MRLRLPVSVRNPVSLLGMAIATTMALLFLILLALELFGLVANPYLGLMVFVTVPTVFVGGLLLIPIGAWWRRRHPRVGLTDEAEWPVIDLRSPRQRSILFGVAALTFVNLLIVSVASYGGVHYMDSTEFCGRTCHTTMEPEYVAHQAGPHARVSCVECHVGPGVDALIASKLAGTHQLFDVVTNQVPKPVPPPLDTLRPASETCEHCHWPPAFEGDQVRTIREYGDDEANTESVTTLRLHVGGGQAAGGLGEGIHWHVNPANAIEYVTTDADRSTIPYVRLTRPDGTVREYVADGATPEAIAAGTRRSMDCMDCHNRPAHTFEPTPERAVDDAIAAGRIPRALPFVRQQAVAAVTGDYADRTAADGAIARELRRFYAARPGADGRLVDQTIAASQAIWARNIFPQMKVTWGTYPSQIGHVNAPGCFRCHDDSHKTPDGQVIPQDCDLCHELSFE